MDLGVNGKLALVTGASQGMLRSVAQILAENGARVAVVARKPEKLKVAVEEMRAFGEVVGYAGDLSSADAVAEVVGAVVADHGEVDILVNGIAMSGGEDKAETVRRDRYGMQVSAVGGTMPVALAPDDASWGRHLDTTLLATVRTCRLVVPSMVARGGGAVVNVSALSSRFHRPNHLQYGAMELAKEYFTVALAKEVGPRGVRVNAVIPGWLRTPRVVARLESLAAEDGVDMAEAERRTIAAWENTAWMQRMGSPEEIANVVVFLASERASYVNGSIYRVDGGAPVGV